MAYTLSAVFVSLLYELGFPELASPDLDYPEVWEVEAFDAGLSCKSSYRDLRHFVSGQIEQLTASSNTQ